MKKYLTSLITALACLLPNISAAAENDDTFHITTAKQYQTKDVGNFYAFTFNVKKATESAKRAESNYNGSLPEKITLKALHIQTGGSKSITTGNHPRLTALIVSPKTFKIRAVSATISTRENTIGSFPFDNIELNPDRHYHVFFSSQPRETLLAAKGKKLTPDLMTEVRFTCRQVDEKGCSTDNIRSWGWSTKDGEPFVSVGKWAPFARLTFEKPAKQIDYFTIGVIALVVLAGIVLIKACKN
ncbi:MAG: hypothetical protein Q4F35_03185 [Akkermansia sp.]|nr:hypothetical protein [Akkermansia sp.]